MPSIFSLPEADAEGISQARNLKENVMNEAPQLELVDLGDAKEETKGRPDLPKPEENQVALFKEI